jgi:hypothetical protein
MLSPLIPLPHRICQLPVPWACIPPQLHGKFPNPHTSPSRYFKLFKSKSSGLWPGFESSPLRKHQNLHFQWLLWSPSLSSAPKYPKDYENGFVLSVTHLYSKEHPLLANLSWHAEDHAPASRILQGNEILGRDGKTYRNLWHFESDRFVYWASISMLTLALSIFLRK